MTTMVDPRRIGRENQHDRQSGTESRAGMRPPPDVREITPATALFFVIQYLLTRA